MEEYYHVRDVARGLARWIGYSLNHSNNRPAETSALRYLIEESHQERIKARQSKDSMPNALACDDHRF